MLQEPPLLPWEHTLLLALPVEVIVVQTVKMSCHPGEALSVLPPAMVLALPALYIVWKVVRFLAAKNGKSVELQSLPDKRLIRTEGLSPKS